MDEMAVSKGEVVGRAPQDDGHYDIETCKVCRARH